MSPEAQSLEPKESFVPNESTLKAWEAQAYMLEYSQSEPNSSQAEVANERANSAFSELTTMTQDFLWASAFKRTAGKTEEVEEILQETYLRAYKALPRFRGDSQVTTWLHQIMFNELSRYYEKKSKEPLLEIDGQEIPEDKQIAYLGRLSLQSYDDVELAVERKESLNHLLELIDDLSPKHRKIVLMQAYYGISQAKIAEALNMTEGAVKVAFCRARKKLRELHPDQVID